MYGQSSVPGGLSAGRGRGRDATLPSWMTAAGGGGEEGVIGSGGVPSSFPQGAAGQFDDNSSKTASNGATSKDSTRERERERRRSSRSRSRSKDRDRKRRSR